ncbi:uncharacterized protein LOC144170480 isoform X2 [Haemaphysalis longicornis]
MSGRATLGDVRPLSPVRIKGFSTVISVTVTISLVLVLCATEPAKAESFNRRPIRSRDLDRTEVLPFSQVFTKVGASVIEPSAEEDWSNPQPKRVKCYYFKHPPVRTYCRVLSMTGVITADAAERECGSIGMKMLSSKTTPLNRLCTLMKIFSLEEHNIWLADVLNETQQLTFDQCKLEILQENVTKLPSSCTICNIAVICDAGFYHSNGSTCVTVEENSGEVEYCYYENGTSARNSVLRCKEESAELMDASKLNGTETLEYVKRLVRTDLEFWVDLKKEDVTELSGVLAFDPEEIDWNTSCITVWFGRDVPWFFRRNCDESYPVICQDGPTFGEYDQLYRKHDDCVYHQSNSWMFSYCIPEDRKFGLTAASEFCSYQNMALLRGSTLRELYYVYANTHPPHQHDIYRFRIWDSGFLEGPDSMSTVCTSTSLISGWPEREKRPCHLQLGYICKQEKPWTCVPPQGRAKLHVEHREETGVSHTEMCVSREELTFEESVIVCEELGMTLFPWKRFDAEEHERLFDENNYTSFWVVPQEGGPSKCVVIHESGFLQMDADCSDKHHAVCTYTIIPGVTISHCDPAIGCSSTTATSTPSTHKAMTGVTAVSTTSEFECDPVFGCTSPKTQTANSGHYGERSSNVATSATITMWVPSNDEVEVTTATGVPHLGPSGSTKPGHEISDGSSDEIRKSWDDIMSSNSIQGVIEGLQDLHEKVGVQYDIQRMPLQLATLLQNVDKLVQNLSRKDRASKTRELANSVVDLAGETMEKRNVWSTMAENERLNAAAGLVNSFEDFVIKMIGYQIDSSGEHKLGSGNLTVQVKQVTKNIAEEGMYLGDQSGSSVTLPANFVHDWTKNVSVIFSENRLAQSLINAMSPSGMSSKHPELVTPFVTATLVTGGSRNTVIGGNVILSFPFESKERKTEPQCSFIETINQSYSRWSERGCELLNTTHDKISCSCNHLTTFAVLMNPRNSVDGEMGHHEELEWITKIGCGISIVCLMACIVIFTAYRHLKGIRNTIHRNLCLSLLIAEILLLVGMKRVKGSNDVQCTIMTFCLHFFFLSAFGWMALEGCHIIVLLWKVFNQKRTYYERYYFAGYGIPLVIAGITLGSRHFYYTHTEEPYCWLPPEKGIRYSFIVPVASVIFLNLGALFLVLWKMSHMRLVVEKSTAEKVQNWVRGTFILLPILGVTWLFGFLMLGTETMHLTGAYLFTIFNSLQGLGIFICHVMMSKKTREAIFKSVVSTGSMVKGSISSRPSGSGTGSSKTTWYPISFSSNSTSISSSFKDGSQADTKQPSQSFGMESDDAASDIRPCARLQWWPGARFRYILRMDDSSVQPVLDGGVPGSSNTLGQPFLATYRPNRSFVA